MACTGSRRIAAMFLQLPALSKAPHLTAEDAPSDKYVCTFASTLPTWASSTALSTVNNCLTADITLSRMRSL